MGKALPLLIVITTTTTSGPREGKVVDSMTLRHICTTTAGITSLKDPIPGNQGLDGSRMDAGLE